MILLNELADEPHNAPLKCFASRLEERKKAFTTIRTTGLLNVSDSYGRITAGLWRLLVKGSLQSLKLEGITPDDVIQFGKEWVDFLLDTTPDEELLARPKVEHLLRQKIKDGRQEGEQTGKAEMLTRQLQRRFGHVPTWANEKIAQAKLSSLEAWSLRIFDAPTLDALFADPV